MRLIDADTLLEAAKAALKYETNPVWTYDELQELIANAPTVQREVQDHIKAIKIPTDTMEQEFQNYYRRGYEAGKKASQREGWVSVEDRLPEYEQVKQRRVRVLVTWKETDAVFTLWYGHRFGYNSPSFFEEYEWTESDLGFIDENDNPFLGETLTYSTITHWQPLPSAPKE